MELKNKLLVGLLSAMLAFTGLACGGDDAADTDVDVETPAGDLGTEDALETETETEEMETDGAEPTETETP